MKPHVQDAFKALADPTRRMILMHLSTQDMTIEELTDRFDMTRAAVKKHLNVLESGRLIMAHKSGRERINRIAPRGLKPVFDWINYFDRFWDERLNNLKNLVETKQGKNDV